MSKAHNGTCSFCGSDVKRNFVTCTGCGATWTPTLGLLGCGLFVTALPCGVATAIVLGMQTRSPEMGMVGLFVGGLGMAGFATSPLFRRWLWVSR